MELEKLEVLTRIFHGPSQDMEFKSEEGADCWLRACQPTWMNACYVGPKSWRSNIVPSRSSSGIIVFGFIIKQSIWKMTNFFFYLKDPSEMLLIHNDTEESLSNDTDKSILQHFTIKVQSTSRRNTWRCKSTNLQNLQWQQGSTRCHYTLWIRIGTEIGPRTKMW